MDNKSIPPTPTYTSTPTPQKSLTWIFVILFLISIGIAGWFYYQNLQLKTQLTSVTKLLIQFKETPTPSPKPNSAESERESSLRCGDFPSNIGVSPGHYAVLSGPLWSPDCRYIAWGVWMSGTSWLGDESPMPTLPDTPDPSEGIFLYNDRTAQTTTVYKPKHRNEAPELVSWNNSDELTFKTQSGRYTYSVTLKTITEQQ